MADRPLQCLVGQLHRCAKSTTGEAISPSQRAAPPIIRLLGQMIGGDDKAVDDLTRDSKDLGRPTEVTGGTEL